MPIVNVKSHKLRVVSMSVYFVLYLSLESVMNAAQWRCKFAFAYYGLKEVSAEYENDRTLGPLVAVGMVIP